MKTNYYSILFLTFLLSGFVYSDNPGEEETTTPVVVEEVNDDTTENVVTEEVVEVESQPVLFGKLKCDYSRVVNVFLHLAADV